MPNISSGSISYNLNIEADIKLGSGADSEALTSLELNFQPGSVSMTGFESIVPENPPGVELPGFAMNLNAVTSIPLFDYTAQDGWDFLISLDADFEFSLPGHEPFTMPVNGLQLGNSGFSIPQQNMNNSTLNGLTLPSFDIAGFTFSTARHAYS